MENKTEAWLTGPIDGVPPVLQPVAHALLQANDEIHTMLKDFPQSRLWEQPAGVASVAFHLQHIPGVLDRLFSYSNGSSITNTQLKYLSEEGLEDPSIKKETLLAKLSEKINQSLEHLKSVDPSTILHERTVGRKKLPSTVLGLLFHAAEHTMRHMGQLLVTARILMFGSDKSD
jgi:uncharacterized damage-inducible protein DinB